MRSRFPDSDPNHAFDDARMDLFVARQPIFDLRRSVAAYELLYRRSWDAADATDPLPASRSGRLMVSAVLGVGLDRLTRGLPAHVNVDAETLLEPGSLELLDPGQVVLEIVETTAPASDVVARCRRLADLGFRIALDDGANGPAFGALLDLASIVKVDVRAYEREALASLVMRLRGRDVDLLAKRVETPEEHRRCVELGFSLFQGFLYVPPETLRERDLPVKTLRLVQVLNVLRDVHSSDREVGELFRADPGLSWKLLRIVNSAALGGRGVESIEHALRLVGRDQLHQWLVLLLLSARAVDDQLRELVWSALLRGRFCELAAERASAGLAGTARPGSAFLAGLFSRMDRLLGLEMPEVLARVDLTQDVRGALLERTGPVGALLGGAEAYEEGRWHDATANLGAAGVPIDDLSGFYLDAVGWAESTIALGRRGGQLPRVG